PVYLHVLLSFPARRSSDLWASRFSKSVLEAERKKGILYYAGQFGQRPVPPEGNIFKRKWFDIIEPELVNRDPHRSPMKFVIDTRSEEHTSELQSRENLVCR